MLRKFGSTKLGERLRADLAMKVGAADLRFEKAQSQGSKKGAA